MREALVAAATALLAQSGPSEIKVRRIAEASGVSTMAVYHHFGGVPELLHAVVDNGFTILRAAMVDAMTASSDPGTQLFVMALATRRIARSNPHLYDMMFGLSTRGTYRYIDTAPPQAASEKFLAASAVFVEACDDLARSGRLSPAGGTQIAAELWSAVHGFVTLELAGHFVHFADPVCMVLAPMAVNHLVGMGDHRPRAEKSASEALDWWNERWTGVSGH
jgi:AcrR family transcriptional regulator